jgi:hypothetical protein
MADKVDTSLPHPWPGLGGDHIFITEEKVKDKLEDLFYGGSDSKNSSWVEIIFATQELFECNEDAAANMIALILTQNPEVRTRCKDLVEKENPSRGE